MKQSGHTILITGGSRGIGLTMAIRLQALDNTVIIVGQDRARLESIQVEYPKLITFCADLRKIGEINQLTNYITKHHSNLSILVNNAAIQNNGSLQTDISNDDLVSEIAINIQAPVLLTKLLLPTLVSQKEAAIINVSSALAIAPKADAPIYCASKAFINSFSISMRYQLENSAVRVIELQPPLVDTDMTRNRQNKDKLSPEQVIEELLAGLEKNEDLVQVGKTKLLALLFRISPSLARKITRNFK